MKSLLIRLFLSIALFSSGIRADTLREKVGKRPVSDITKAPEILQYVSDGGLQNSATLADISSHGSEEFRLRFFSKLWGTFCRDRTSEDSAHIIEALTYGLNDPYVGAWIIERLAGRPLEANDLSPTARSLLLDYDYENGRTSDYIKTLGVAGIDDPRIDLNALRNTWKDPRTEENASFSPPFTYYDTAAWTAMLVLARRGDADALKTIMDQVKQMSLKELSQHPRRIIELGYVRKDEAIKFLIALLQSDEGQLGTDTYFSTDDSGARLLAEWAFEALENCIDGFPYDSRNNRVFWDDVLLAREFIAALNGKWVVRTGFDPGR